MKVYNNSGLEKYLQDDFIQRKLSLYPDDARFTSHKWLNEMPAKRFIYADVYGDLFSSDEKKKILDVGGGFCGLTRELVRKHDYHLLDMMYHDSESDMRNVELQEENFWIKEDWFNFIPDEQYDLIIANDIFPNVDQRLELFIEKFLPVTKKIVITLTCYDHQTFYTVKRQNGDEFFNIVPWSSDITFHVLNRFFNSNIFSKPNNTVSIFANKRIVYRLDLPR